MDILLRRSLVRSKLWSGSRPRYHGTLVPCVGRRWMRGRNRRRESSPRRRQAEVLEAEADAARELELVRVLGVPHHVAAPVGIAPITLAVRLDVGGRPPRLETDADVLPRVGLDPDPGRPRELRVAADLPLLAVHRREAHARIARGPGADEDEGTRARVRLTEVVGVGPVIGLDAEVADVPHGRSADLEGARLLAVDELQL